MHKPVLSKSAITTNLTRSLLEDALAVMVVGFVVLGVGGLVYKMLRPDGWVSNWLQRLWDQSPSLVWLAGFLCAILVIAGKHIYHRNARGSSARGNAIAYAFLALGLFFFFKLLVTGAL